MTGSASRLLLKLSGEAFKGTEGALSSEALSRIAGEIVLLTSVELAVVVGGGNIVRGARAEGTRDRLAEMTLKPREPQVILSRQFRSSGRTRSPLLLRSGTTAPHPQP